MSLFKPIEPPPHLKGGIFGFAGSGKTYTAVEIAIGLHKYIGSKKPIYGLETETGLSYLRDKFKENNIELNVLRTRAFVSLIAGLEEIARDDNIVIIDSITHYWQELVKAYLTRHGKTRLSMRDFLPLKEEWQPFPTTYLNSKCHIIMCGRSQYTWGETEDEEGNSKTVQTGTKMKVEGDLGYEPTLLIEMEQFREQGKIGSELVNRAWILKDKFSVIKGQHFDMPTFENFLPHIQKLNIGGAMSEIDTATNSVGMIQSDKGGWEQAKSKTILMEELENELSLHFNSRKDEGKTALLNFLKENYGTTSKTAIANLSNDKIKEGLEKLKQLQVIVGKE